MTGTTTDIGGINVRQLLTPDRIKGEDITARTRQISEAAIELEQIRNSIKQLNNRKEKLEHELVEQVGVDNSIEFGDTMTIKISDGRKTLNAKAFEAAYPPAENPGCYQLKPLALSQLVRKFGEDALADCITTGKPTVKVSVNEQQ